VKAEDVATDADVDVAAERIFRDDFPHDAQPFEKLPLYAKNIYRAQARKQMTPMEKQGDKR
jgi:hypothetical protein